MAVICDIINYLSISVISSDNSILPRLFKNAPVDADAHLMNNNISHFCPNSNNLPAASRYETANRQTRVTTKPHTTATVCDGQYAKLKPANVCVNKY